MKFSEISEGQAFYLNRRPSVWVRLRSVNRDGLAALEKYDATMNAFVDSVYRLEMTSAADVTRLAHLDRLP
jgi:hypothetical protein